MLDVLYILIGAAFLGGCILYAKACDVSLPKVSITSTRMRYLPALS